MRAFDLRCDDLMMYVHMYVCTYIGMFFNPNPEQEMGKTSTINPVPCLAYITGHTQTGAKVGLVLPWRPAFEVECIPMDKPEAARQGAKEKFVQVLRKVTDRLRLRPGAVEVQWHIACRFYGYVPTPGAPTQRRRYLYARVAAPNKDLMASIARMIRWDSAYATSVHEDGIDAEQLFIEAHCLTPSAWHFIPKSVLIPASEDQRQMLVHYEFAVEPTRGQRTFTPAPEVTTLPSLVLVVLDAEMTSATAGRFPHAARAEDAVVVVSLVCAYVGGDAPGRPARTVFRRHALVLAPEGRVDPIPGATMAYFDHEADLLAAVRDFCFCDVHMDILAGHNIVSFDMKYLAQRAGMNADPDAPLSDNRLARFSVLLRDVVRPKDRSLSSAGLGSNSLYLLPGMGFAYLDSMLVVKQHPRKLSVFTLAVACAEFLPKGITKHDMPYEDIPGIVASGDSAAWAALVGYCIQDSELVFMLLGALDTIRCAVLDSRIIKILMAQNTTCGQQQRVRDTLLRKARCQNPPMVMNRVNDRSGPRKFGGRGGGAGGAGGAGAADDPDGAADITADGGCVLDNIAGLHDVPVVVLDFASLYPSVQRSRNLCWSTVVEPDVLATLTAEDRTALGIVEYQTATGTFYFVTNVTGVFPAQLRDLLMERKAAKKDMVIAETMKAAAKKAGDAHGVYLAEAAYGIADARQKSTKIVMNSGYGTANAKEGTMPCRAVGTVTCMVGAQLNAEARKFVETTFGAVCIYGDTDSVMMAFPEPPHLDSKNPAHRLERLKHANAMGRAAEAALNARFHDIEAAWKREKARATGTPEEPVENIVQTEHEKTYFPFNSITKKVYTGIKFTDDPAEGSDPTLAGLGKLEAKGIKMVRRDVPQFTKVLTEDLLDALLMKRSLAKFWDTVHAYVLQVCLGPAEYAAGDSGLVTDWSPSPRPPFPLTAFVLTKGLKEGYTTKAATPHSAVAFAAEQAVPGSGPQVGDRVPFVIVSSADTKRLRLDGKAPGKAKDDEKVAAFARSPQEVMANPSANLLDVDYYVSKCICTVVKQLCPSTEVGDFCDRAEAFAKAMQAALVTARGPDVDKRSLWASLNVLSKDPPKMKDTATIMRSLPPLRFPRLDTKTAAASATADASGATAAAGTGLDALLGTTSTSALAAKTAVHKKTAAERRREKEAEKQKQKQAANYFKTFLTSSADDSKK